MSEKVEVISNSRGTVYLTVPHLNLKKEWSRKNAKASIDKDVLMEALYDPGVEYMFTTGLLYIKDMKTKIELGLEPEGAAEPENIIILTDEEKAKYMSSTKMAWELKEVLEKLSYEGKRDFCDYVVDNELLDTKKSAIIKEVCGFDVLRAIQLKQANEEKDAE